MIEAVVFDLDGVLVDSEPVWEEVRRQLVAEHGGHWAPDAQQRLMGMSTGSGPGTSARTWASGSPPDQVAEWSSTGCGPLPGAAAAAARRPEAVGGWPRAGPSGWPAPPRPG